KLIISTNLDKSEYKSLVIDRNYFNKLEKIIQSYLIDKIFNMVTTSSTNHLNYQLIQNAIHLINNQSSRKLNLPQNIILEVDYKSISFYENNKDAICPDINPLEIRLDGSITKFDNWELRTEKIENIDSGKKLEQIINIAKEKNYEGYFDYDNIGCNLFIRYRNIGDKFEPIGLSGHQSLKKFMSNRHIPISQRDTIPIITNGSKILWVIPYQTSQFARITNETTTILKISVVNE
ncbi:MAG: tRNA lysidine(34) synthetase TilS, partial [SAR202 cluster bacterium]|nr:tRNA lysidine(34) synthetase TilS [SAR202 cluster bacterium]